VKHEFTKPGGKRSDLEAAWQDRLADAEALLAAGRHAWAIATGLYALEIRLKVLICKRLDLQHLPKGFEIHDLDGLLLLTGLSQKMQKKGARKTRLNWDGIVNVARVLNDLRYQPAANWTATDSHTFFRRLNDPPDGVLPWLSRQR
jgi:hypothetical protein